ncbi:prolyl oligopeptidase family serine peptidase [Streptomyces sp. GC420]|nr:prolyl oligopeptidase family serine peptidase [Streptomyces sp. GC420]
MPGAVPGQPDEDAVAQDAAEAEAAFSHEAVAPDATASYGTHPDQLVDFYAPRSGGGSLSGGPGGSNGAGGGSSAPARAPLVVVLHGGAWRAAYDRRHISPFAAFLAGRGFAVASVEYRRGPGGDGGVESGEAGRWPETFDDVAAAMDALPDLAAGVLPQADVGRTVVTGHSAGGHLALWASARHLLPADSPWRAAATPLRGVVALAPIADLVRAEELGVCSHASAQLLGGAGRFEERLPYADPVALLPTGVATTLVQGRTDIVVPPRVAESFADAAAKAGEPVRLVLLDGAGHFPLIDPVTEACARVAEEIARLARLA